MKIAEVKLSAGKIIKECELNFSDWKLGDEVVVKTEDFGLILGRVVTLKEVENKETKEPRAQIQRLANSQDFQKAKENEAEKSKIISVCEKYASRAKLNMKVVDGFFSLDGLRLTFLFSSPERLDFRPLVRDLTSHFHKAIRLHQIGARDTAKTMGDLGPCGQTLCCRKFLKRLGSVSTDLIGLEQLSHRGSERLSGACGRLKCCLTYEEEIYRERDKLMPKLETKIETNNLKGRVVGRHLLKNTVKIETDDGKQTEVPFKEIRKKD